MKLIILIVIALSLAATGCITYNEANDPADPEVVYVTQTPEIVYVTQTPEPTVPCTNFGAIIITTVAPGTEAVLWKDCNGVMTVYDSMIAGENGEVKLIAPVPGMYTLTTAMGECLVSVEESDILAQNTISVH